VPPALHQQPVKLAAGSATNGDTHSLICKIIKIGISDEVRN